MTKIIYIFLAFVLLFTACQEKDKIEFVDLGTEFLISGGDMTNLDDNSTISIKNNEKNLSSIAVSIVDGNKLGDIAIADGVGSIVLKGADLGISNVEDNVNLMFESSFNGKAIKRYYSVEVVKAAKATEPEILHKDTVYHYVYSVAPVSATVTSVSFETKVSEAGTYAAVTPIANDLKEDSIAFNGNDYNINDTIFVRVIAATATKIDTTLSELVVMPDSYENVTTFSLDTTANLAYDLILGKAIESTVAFGDSADIQFIANYTATGLQIGFKSDNNADFVLATSVDYINADILNIEATDFSTSVKIVDNASTGDVYIYRTRRGTEDYSYGIIKLVNVDKPQGVLEDSYIEFEYKH